MMWITTLTVALGGALGASLRFATNQAVLRWFGAGFPFGTMCVNIIGSFVMGVVIVTLSQFGSRFAPFIVTGVLGSFTTFSAFSADAVQLYQKGALMEAAFYTVFSVIAGITALILGMALARAVFV